MDSMNNSRSGNLSVKRVRWFDLNVEPEEERERVEVGGVPSVETAPPAEVKLPRSSTILDIGGASFLDFISVYAFLRSFSTVVFMSPFEIDEFAESVVYKEPTPLFDAIHLSLMRALRRYTSESTLLRSLNWDLLDSITWPVFLVEYVLLRKPKDIPGLDDLSELNHLDCDYYAMPSSVKVAILQHLCDDLVETEVYRSELDKRAMMAESGDWKMKYYSSSSSKGDVCFLCKMVGKLICCDSCPASMHARCVGVVTSQLPEGEWHCPECRLDQGNCYNLANSIRGAHLLGTDHHARSYYAVCHYLLVMVEQLCAGESCSLTVYKRDDLGGVVGALDESSSSVLHERIIEHWDLTTTTTLQAHSATQAEDGADQRKNLYEFAGLASLISEEMTSAVTATRSSEQIMEKQLKVIRGDKPKVLSWLNTHHMNVYMNSKKEKCGWCFACNNARDCLFITADVIRATDVLAIQPRKGRKKRLDEVEGKLMWIENLLRALLQDPSFNPRNPDHVASLNKVLRQGACLWP